MCSGELNGCVAEPFRVPFENDSLYDVRVPVPAVAVTVNRTW
jgi:hypothetical protein